MSPDRAAGLAIGRSRADCQPAQIDYLLELVEQTKDVPGDIAEFGSWRGGTAIAMASQTGKFVHAFDLFGGLPYGPGRGFENFGATSYDEIFQATKPFGISLHRGLHEKTVCEFAASKPMLSLIFLDSDHYSSHRIVLTKLQRFLSPDGVIAFHDWHFAEVQQAIREFIKSEEYEFMPKDVGGMRAIRAL